MMAVKSPGKEFGFLEPIMAEPDARSLIIDRCDAGAGAVDALAEPGSREPPIVPLLAR
jgi:hypothetical protein